MNKPVSAGTVLVQAAWPTSSLRRDVALILLGSWLVALLAQLEIPLFPVPITGQTFAVLLVGALLGRRRGALALLIYLAQGAAGLPVFAGGSAGIARLLGPTGGYLIGFVAAAYIVCWLSERDWDRHLLSAALAMLVGNSVIYVFGLAWLARFVGWPDLVEVGLFPFIIGDALKIALAALALPGGWALLK